MSQAEYRTACSTSMLFRPWRKCYAGHTCTILCNVRRQVVWLTIFGIQSIGAYWCMVVFLQRNKAYRFMNQQSQPRLALNASLFGSSFPSSRIMAQETCRFLSHKSITQLNSTFSISTSLALCSAPLNLFIYDFTFPFKARSSSFWVHYTLIRMGTTPNSFAAACFDVLLADSTAFSFNETSKDLGFDISPHMGGQG